MKKLILPALFILLFCGLGSCDKDNGRTTLCNCSGQFYRFKAGGSTLVFPTAFTPNNDGRNDIFGAIHANMQATGFNLTVYNGAKEVIYTTNDLYSGWNGLINGVRAPAGRYEVTFHATTISGNYVESCTCVTLVDYEAPFDCIRATPGTYQFADQFDIGSGEPSFNTTEKLCP